MRVLVIGESGQLARALARKEGVACIGRGVFDLTSATPASTEALLRAHAADLVINAAAYTAVDKAEAESAAAYALNEAGPRTLATACVKLGAPLIHMSTDYVFDGRKAGAYVETDPAAPQGIYGASKAAGERAVLQSGARATVLRTSWLYASEGANFVHTMLRLAQTQDEIAVVDDQHGHPTWAADLADACCAIAARLAARDHAVEGILHFSGAGDATWAEFAEAIFAHARARGWRAAAVKRVATSDVPRPAPRPQNSRLDTSKYAALIAPPRPWREALELCMKEMTPP